MNFDAHWIWITIFMCATSALTTAYINYRLRNPPAAPPPVDRFALADSYEKCARELIRRAEEYAGCTEECYRKQVPDFLRDAEAYVAKAETLRKEGP